MCRLCATAQFSCAAPVALQLAARHRSRVICHPRDGRSVGAACCMLHVACCMPCVSCRMLHAATAASSFRTHARTRARAQRASPDAFVGMASADEVVGRSVSRPRSHTKWVLAAAHTVHGSCIASIAEERCWVAARTDRGHRQRCREGAAGGRDGEEPGRLVHRAAASLQGTPQRRRWALVARMVPAARCLRTSAHGCRA